MRELISSGRCLTGMAALLLCIMVAPEAFGQLTADDIAVLEQRAIDEGWTFTVRETPATQYSLDQICGLNEPPNWRTQGQYEELSVTRDLPDAFDWRDEFTLTPVKNQGGCGGCWAFAANGVFENLMKMKDSVEIDLSEQWLISCSDAGTCEHGGWYSDAFPYYQYQTDICGDHGAVLEADYPFEEADSPCACPVPHYFHINSWAWIGSGAYSTPTIEQMKQAIVEYGPIAIALHASDALQAYGGGIFNACETGSINHATVLVGWDDTQGTNGVWIMRNSWGQGWGE
ncbi:MAG: C1 family peptidase, partial [candidate division Zixibacteria bacterium]|nr:C1 family peptidase [candidate division Zixibacteria bacterium]